MSEPRVAALVCEGQTDLPILRAILEKLWPGIEIRALQPETDATGKTVPRGRTGWTAVHQWCQQNANLLEVVEPAVGDRLDVLVIALDVDIALEARGARRATVARAYDARDLCRTVKSWLTGSIPTNVIIALPAMAIEAWVIAALFPKTSSPEAIPDPARYLMQTKKLRSGSRDGKPMKYLPTYRDVFGPAVARRLSKVRRACGEAERTCRKIEACRTAVEAETR